MRRSRAAAAPSGFSLLSRRLGELAAPLLAERRAARAGFGMAAGVLAGLAGGWAAPALGGCAGVLFGWPGIAAFGLACFLTAEGLRPDVLAAFVAAAAATAPGVAIYLTFRSVPDLGRGLPNLRSHLWLLGSGLLGGLAGGLLMAAAANGPAFQAFWNQAAGTLTGVVLLGPPVLLVADRFFRLWMVSIPAELPARRSRRLGLAPETIQPRGDETMRVAPARRRLEIGHALLIGAAVVVGLTLVAVPVSRFLPQSGPWILLVYLVPILGAALDYGMRGGILASSASGIIYLVGLSGLAALTGGPGTDLWVSAADFVILSLAGAFVGESREAEAQTRDELMDANRLLRHDLLNVALALTQAVEAKDSYTEGHLHRVSEYAVTVGSRLGLRGHDLEMLHFASLLHDIGKIGIPEHVLGKEGPLDEFEAEVMKRHPAIGARILERLDLLKDAAPIVLHHQERYDGDLNATYPGYPGGLRGERIPLGARIVAVVDAFDAMTTDRPYRAALSVEQAIEELRNQRGRQFDPRVVDTFLQVLAEQQWRRMGSGEWIRG
ncbi:MAG TPA: HD domain-containing phosphohydrolase [Thermoanaerobaculia bacterium]|nr:HD domain-containing phosphohydrolase [Thermoanaerobaculia bacterium]